MPKINPIWEPGEKTVRGNKITAPKLFGLYPKEYQRTKLLLALREKPCSLAQLVDALPRTFHRKGFKSASDYIKDVIRKMNKPDQLPSVGYQIVERGGEYELVRTGSGRTETGDKRPREIIPTSTQPTITEEEYLEVLNELESLESPREIAARKEQSYHRQNLFGGRTNEKCSICGRVFPVELLVAAHIKRREKCSVAEKRDPNNIARMCKLGCDDLFERGYVAVRKGGYVVINRKSASTPDLDSCLREIEGRRCSSWGEKSSSYFEWQRKNVARLAE
jgi:hypothetical protein